VKEVLDGVDRGNKKPPICGQFLCRREPSDGLEPSTPSLPWRFRAAGGGLRNSACYGVFPAATAFRLPDAPLPPRALSLPERPRTCPQNPSPRRARPSRWWTPSAKRPEARSKGAFTSCTDGRLRTAKICRGRSSRSAHMSEARSGRTRPPSRQLRLAASTLRPWQPQRQLVSWIPSAAVCPEAR
jgi:hypothetical protein